MSVVEDWKKLLILEACPGKQLQAVTWTDVAHSDTWRCDFAFGEVSDVKIDGVSLTREYTFADCDATADSFYHDFFAGLLYVHLTSGDSPGDFVSPDYTYDVVAYVWRCFVNRQAQFKPRGTEETISYIPDGCICPHYYEPMLLAGSLAQLSAAIADHFESAMQTSYGSVSLSNDLGQWYAEIDDWYWSNAQARAKVGEVGDLYAALETIFIGCLHNPEVNDEAATFELIDVREGKFQSIPPEHFETVTYPGLDPDLVGVPIPILFGEKANITPPCIDTYISPGGRTYKISQTHFGSDVFELESIDAVYLKDVALSVGTHYTEDLHNGEFTLLFDPGDALVTCDAKGIKNEFDFSSGAATGNYSENVADHLFFVLHVLNEIPIADIDLDSFDQLQTARTQAVAWYLDQDTATLDFNRLLQQTSLYHFLPLADGTFAARYYRKTVPTGTLELRNYDHAEYKKMRPNDGVFRDVYLKYGKDPTTGTWQQVIHAEDKTHFRHRTKDPFVVETALRDELEAISVLAFYTSLLKDPPTKIETSISMIGKDLIPTDKLYVNRSINADGHEVTIAEDDVYVILESRRDISAGRVGIVAQLDTQLAIYTVYADSPHQDVSHADHSDTIHEDDTHGDDHTDTAYVDHTDTAHDDSHSDEVHVDHTDGVHEDQAHDDSHVDHSDTSHDDDAYEDVPHVDTSHVDHSDTLHTDAHTDVSHIDSEV